MNENFETLEKVNWILQPVSDIILFFFTTETGWVLLFMGVVIYVIATVYNALWVRQLAHSASRSRGRMSIIEFIYIVISQLSTIVINMVSRLPIILGSILILLGITGLSKGLSSLQEFYENEQRIKELQTIVKHLEQEYKVAEITVKNVDASDMSNVRTTLECKYLDYADMGINSQPQEITIKGNDIYVDALVLNFDYSLIETGKSTNLAIPYRIFSNEVAQKNGIALNTRDTAGVPFIFHRKAENLYGIDEKTFNARTKELAAYLNDEKKARAAGIRTTYGQFVHKRVRTGETFAVWITQQGGIILKNEENF